MAKYRLQRKPDGTYSLQGSLYVGRKIVAQETQVSIKHSNLSQAAEDIASSLGKTRARLKMALVDGSIEGVTD